MKNVFRLVSVLLCAAIMASFTFYSCDKAPTADKPTNPGTEITSETLPGETTEKPAYQFAEQDYGGYTFRLLNMHPDNFTWAMPNEIVAEQTGEPINDALYIRNSLIEDKLNVKLTDITSKATNIVSTITKSVKAGSDEFDIAISCSFDIGPIAASGMLVDLYTVPGLDLTHPWWDQGSIKSYELNNKLFFFTGDHHLLNNDAAWIVYFNKQMIRDLGLDSPYELVNTNKWTIDRMAEMCKAATRDVDGDGAYTASDKWGLATHGLAYSGFLVGLGEDLIRKNSEGIPVYTDANQRFVNAYEKILALMQTPGYTLDVNKAIKGLPSDKHATKNFLNNDALFCVEVLAHTRVFRSMDNDFGLLPHPMLNEEQGKYYTMMTDTVGVTCIPITNPDLERTAVILEALGGVSRDILIPAYYETSIQGKYVRDTESIAMLDKIRENRVYSLSAAYKWGDVFNQFNALGAKNDPNIVSFIDKNTDKVNAAIQKTLDAFDTLA